MVADADDREWPPPNCLVLEDHDVRLVERRANSSEGGPMIVIAIYREDPERCA